MSSIYIDCTNGISSDMVLMALRGLGAQADLTGKLHFHGRDHDHGHAHEHEHDHGHTHAHGHASYQDVLHVIEHSLVSEQVKETARSIYGVIARAEASVHGATLETVHFHEVGRREAIENIIAIAAALEELGVEEVFCSEVHDGYGTILCSHGEIPVPVPAVAAMMKESDLTFATDDIPTEMVTPSGLGVLMGIGEPLDNFDNVVRFLQLVNDPRGMNIGMRHITLSTCGLTERFDDLAALDLQLTLTVSLHAPDDETRSRIMPANRGRGVDEVIAACKRYYQKTGRRISFEYAMIDGVNDTAEHALLLAKRARDCGAHVNLIPLNHVEERRFRPSTQGHMKAFMRILDENGVNYTVRRTLGSDVDASCGQLRRKMEKNAAGN